MVLYIYIIRDYGIIHRFWRCQMINVIYKTTRDTRRITAVTSVHDDINASNQKRVKDSH